MYTVDDQLPQPHRNSTNCDRHPDGHCTGFCPSCLFERLTILDHSSSLSASNPITTAGRKSTSSALKSLGPAPIGERTSSRIRPGSFLPELRRSKSFTGVKNEVGSGVSGIFGSQRQSCDPRARNSLFIQDNGKRTTVLQTNAEEQLQGKFGSSNAIVVELKEKRVCVREERSDRANGGEIEEIDEPIVSNYIISNPKLSSEKQMGTVNKKTTKKTNVDLDAHSKERPGSFWSAASLFSKKLKAWTTKNSKLKKHSGRGNAQIYMKSNEGRNYKEAQTEVADYDYGRRSCDIDRRFCMDPGRMSLDYGRYSFDEPRASCDGRLTNLPRIIPCMVSLMENPSPHQPSKLVLRKDNLIPSEEGVPGGPNETKDYYMDSSSSRRRKSLDRSSSMKRTAAAVVAEIDEMKTAESLHSGAAKGIMCSESFDITSDKKIGKKSRSWKSWNIWGLIARRSSNKDEDDDRNAWQEHGCGVNGRRDFSRNGFRSNSSVSWRN